MAKINFKRTPEQVAMVKAMADKDPVKRASARQAFAEVIAPTIQTVLLQGSIISSLYKDIPFERGSGYPTIPLDLYVDTQEDHVQVWSQSQAGGLASSFVSGLKEMVFQCYELDSAVNFLEKYAAMGNLDVVAKAVARMANEILVKQDKLGWNVILKALAEASTNTTSHVISATTAGVFQINDLNKMITRIKRINVSYAQGTPDMSESQGLTDIVVSPEIMEQIRAFAYQPMNTRSGAVASNGASSIALPDSVRTEIYNNPGLSSIYGVRIHELLEFGMGQRYNAVFDTYYTPSFTPATQELIVGLDMGREGLLHPVAVDGDSNGQIVISEDDQFVKRQKKMGFYAELEEARVCVDARMLVGCIV